MRVMPVYPCMQIDPASGGTELQMRELHGVQGGLVVIDARYGVLDAILEAEEAEARRLQQEAASSAITEAVTDSPQQGRQQDSRGAGSSCSRPGTPATAEAGMTQQPVFSCKGNSPVPDCAR